MQPEYSGQKKGGETVPVVGCNSKGNKDLTAGDESVFIADGDRRILDANDTACRRFGYTREEMLGLRIDDIVSPKCRDSTSSRHASLLKNGGGRFENLHVTRDGRVFPVEVHAVVIEYRGEPAVLSMSQAITEVRRTDHVSEATGEMEKKFRSFLEVASDGFIVIDSHGVVLDINERFAAMLGYPKRSVLGHTLFSFLHFDEEHTPDSLIRSAIENGSVRFEAGVVSDSEVVLALEFCPIVLQGEQCIRVVAHEMVVGSSEEGELSVHQDIFEKIFSSGCEAFVLLDGAYDIRMWNTAAEEMFGYSAEEVRDKNIFPLLFSREPKEGQRIFQRFLEPGATSSGGIPAELSLNTKEGGVIHTEASVSRLIHQGNPYFLLIIRDNTERHQFIELLTESEEFLRFAIDAARVGIWDYRIEEDCFSMSEDIFAMLSLGNNHSSASSVFSDVWRDAIHPDDILTSESIDLAIMGGSIIEFDFEVRLRTVDGTWNWFALEGKVVEYSTTGRPQRVVGIIRDVQGKKQAEEAIREANRKLSLLAGITRHDVLNQIQGLLFYSEEMKTGEYTMDEVVVMAGKINEMTENINRQIVRTRNYDMLGTEPPEWQNIHYLADEIVAGVDNVGLIYQNELPMVEVYADYLFAEVLRTIVENIRHAEGATTFSVRFAEMGDSGILIIEDDGCGIPLRNKEKIFSHSFSKGSGGGLFIAREIAGVTGIELYEAGEVGKGGRFELTIPKSGYRFVRTEDKEEA